MTTTLIKYARIVNDGQIKTLDLRIEQIAAEIPAQPSDHIIDASGCYLLPKYLFTVSLCVAFSGCNYLPSIH